MLRNVTIELEQSSIDLKAEFRIGNSRSGVSFWVSGVPEGVLGFQVPATKLMTIGAYNVYLTLRW